jgi:biopolymer transport protein ExbD
MAKVKVKKQSTFIDMTAMSDVTVLLLTFFMLTSTFISKEPVQVTTPSSVAEHKIPETNIMTILVDSIGKVFLSLDNKDDMVSTLKAVGEDYGISFEPKQMTTFRTLPSFGIPIRTMGLFLDLPMEAQDKYLKDLTSKRVGIPTDSVEVSDSKGVISSDNEFKRWVSHAKRLNKERQIDQGVTDVSELRIAIKADQYSSYPVIKKVMDDLREMRENRYILITNLKTASAE